MPLFGRDRYQRLDGSGAGSAPGRKPSSFCSSATVVVFVALCLVAAWMMASSNNIPVSVSPENKSEAKEEAAADMAVDVSQSVKGGGGGADDDTPRTGVDGAGAGRKGDGNGDDAPQTSGEAGGSGKKDDDGAGETTRVKGDEGYGDKTGEGDGATRTTDAGSSDVAGTTDATSGGEEEETSKPAAAGAVAEGETPSKNQTFSDENGKTEGGEVAKPEDPEKKAEQSSEDTGGVKADSNAKPAVTDDKDTGGDQADKSGQEASTTDDANGDTGGQADTSTQDQETPTDGGVGMAKNQTTFDDANGKVDGAGTSEQDGTNVAENSSDEAASSSDKEQTTTDNDGAGTAPRNETQAGDLGEAMAFAAADDTTNGTMYQDAKSATTTNSSSTVTELLPSGQADLLNETASAAGESTFPTQAAASSEEKKKNKKKKKKNKTNNKGVTAGETETTTTGTSYTWKLCNTSAGADYIPCLDNTAAIRKLKSTKHYEHRERHCPSSPPSCLVPLPEGYKQPIPWPHSRDKIWYHNVPHASLAHYKGHQNWVKVSGEHLTFPGGGTQFKNGGAGHYADLMEKALSPELLTWGKRSRVVLDVGCGVASFGGALFDRDALTMSFAPKDEHEAQTQFALERGIPAVSAVMGTLRLPFPGGVFDVVHCARCRVPWHIEGGKLLLEVNRLLRPGGLFVWSATPVYRKVPEDVQIWHAMTALTKSMCWEMVKRTSDTVDQTAMVVFRKPTSNACYDARPATTTRSSSEPQPPMCEAADDPDAAWNVTLQACMHRVPTEASARGSKWPAMWPERLRETPYWLGGDGRTTGVYGKPAPEDFAADMEHWRKVVENSYVNGLGIDWKNVRNVMDMRAVYGGFAAALGDMKVWVMNVVPVDSLDTLPIIYERGLFGMYHDWCESFSTYPRSYDLLHADHLFSGLKTRCLKQQQLLPAVVEVDRILRPGGTLIVRDDKGTVEEVRSVVESMRWEVRMTVSKQGEELLCVRKTMWRPTEVEALS